MSTDTIPERMTRVETKMENIFERLGHLDICLDSLKKIVWQAMGGGCVIVVIAQFLIAKFLN